MSDDLISRQLVMKTLCERRCGDKPKGCPSGFCTESLAVDCIPSEKPAQQWIPCSERLPEAEDCPMDCLVTRKSKYIGNYTDMAVCEKNGMWTHEDWDAIVLGDVKDGKSTGLISTRDDDIIAWMPLPEPYKGGEQNG